MTELDSSDGIFFLPLLQELGDCTTITLHVIVKVVHFKWGDSLKEKGSSDDDFEAHSQGKHWESIAAPVPLTGCTHTTHILTKLLFNGVLL